MGCSSMGQSDRVLSPEDVGSSPTALARLMGASDRVNAAGFEPAQVGSSPTPLTNNASVV